MSKCRRMKHAKKESNGSIIRGNYADAFNTCTIYESYSNTRQQYPYLKQC